MNKKLYRSRKDRAISGICGGLAQFTGVPTWLIRVIVILLALTDGMMLLVLIAYVVLSFVLPEGEQGVQSEYTVDGQSGQAQVENVPPTGVGQPWTLVGLALVVWGIYMLLGSLLHISLGQYVLPVLLLVGGVTILVWAFRKK